MSQRCSGSPDAPAQIGARHQTIEIFMVNFLKQLAQIVSITARIAIAFTAARPFQFGQAARISARFR